VLGTPPHVVVHYIVIKYASYNTVVFDYIQFCKFHTHNGDDTLPRFLCMCCYSPQMLLVSPINLGNFRLKPQISLHLITETYLISLLRALPRLFVY